MSDSRAGPSPALGVIHVAAADDERLPEALDFERLLNRVIVPPQGESPLRSLSAVGIDYWAVLAADQVLHALPFEASTPRYVNGSQAKFATHLSGCSCRWRRPYVTAVDLGQRR
jgi:hypothetical protein